MVNFGVGKFLNSTDDVISYIGPNTSIEGDLHADASIHIDGKVKGSVLCNGDVIIGETCKFQGSIKAKNVMVSGHIIGDIESSNGLEIMATGKVEGDIKGSKLFVHEGGIYKGKVNMDVIEAQSIYEGLFQVVPT